MLYAGEKVFDDSNYHELIGDGHAVVSGGERRLLARIPKPTHHNSSGYCSAKFSDKFGRIPRSEWSDRLKEQIRLKARVSDYCDFTAFDQDGLPTCWAIGTCQAATIARRIMGLPLKRLSGCSIAVPISGGHSGGYEGEALEYMAKHGAASTDTWKENDTRRSLNTDAAVVADRQNFKALEFVEMESFDDWATMCLLTFAGTCAYNFWSHVVSIVDLVEIERGSFGLRHRNSWAESYGVKNDLGFGGFNVMREGRGTPSSGWMIRQLTAMNLST